MKCISSTKIRIRANSLTNYMVISKISGKNWRNKNFSGTSWTWNRRLCKITWGSKCSISKRLKMSSDITWIILLYLPYKKGSSKSCMSGLCANRKCLQRVPCRMTKSLRHTTKRASTSKIGPSRLIKLILRTVKACWAQPPIITSITWKSYQIAIWIFPAAFFPLGNCWICAKL